MTALRRQYVSELNSHSLKSLVPFKVALIAFSFKTIEREAFSAED